MNRNNIVPRISIIIPVFNKIELTQKCLMAIEDTATQHLFEVIIIDNASTDGTAKFFKNFIAPFELRYLRNNENRGYAKANNQGAAMARGNYLLLLNNDTEPQEGYLEALVDVFEKYENVGAVGSKLLFPDGTIQHIGVITIHDELNQCRIIPVHIGYKQHDTKRYDKLFRIHCVTGACMMIPTELFKKVGGLDEFYWNGYEDVDICFKLLNAGYGIYCQPNSLVIHNEAQSGPQRWVRSKENLLRLNNKWGNLITCQFVIRKDGSCTPNNGVTFVIVVQNLENDITFYLGCLNKILREHDEVVIVDNGSLDSSVDKIKKFITGKNHYRLIENPYTANFIEAADQGASCGRCPYILFFPAQVTFTKDCLEKLVFHLKDHKTIAASLASNGKKEIQKNDSSHQKSCNGQINSRKRMPSVFEKLAVSNDDCLIIKRKMYNLIGETDNPLSKDDIAFELSSRLRSIGYDFEKIDDVISVCRSIEINDQVPKAANAKSAIQRFEDRDAYRSKSGLGEENWLTSIIILTYNQLEYTRLCIQSIFKHTHLPYELIVVDNGSADGTPSYIASLKTSRTACHRIAIIENKQNVGFAKGCNQGLLIAKGGYALLLNNDVVVTPGWLPALVRVMRNDHNIGLVGPMSNYVSGAQLVNSPGYNLASLDGLERFAEEFADQKKGRREPARRIVGFCMLIRMAVIETIGGLDERFNLGNFEDDDFCLRAQLAGYKAVIAKGCYVHHFGGRTFLGNKIDYKHKIEQNWNIFKEKWGISPDTSLGAAYRVINPREDYDIEKFFIPLVNKQQETTNSKTMDANSENHPLLCVDQQEKSGYSTGGISMTNMDHVYEIVKHHFSENQKNEAIWILKHLVEEVPQHAEAHHELGLLLFEQGRIDDAHYHLTHAVDLTPDNVGFVKDLADYFNVAKNDTGQAIRLYERLTEINPTNDEAFLTLGHLYLSQHNFEKARECYQNLLRIDPDNSEIRQYLDKLEELSDKRNPDMSNHASNIGTNPEGQQYLAVQPGNLSDMDQQIALSHNDLGVADYRKGKKESALQHYIKAVTLDPENVTYLKNLADFHWIERHDAKSAMEQYVQVLKIDPLDVEALMACGHICEALDRRDDAREFIENVIQLEPWNDTARQMLKRLDADDEFDASPVDRDTLVLSARKKTDQNDWEGAICDLNRLVAEYPDDDQAYNDLGVLSYNIGNKEQALSCYERAVELVPDHGTYLKNLADFYFIEQKRAEDAMKLYVKVLEENPEDVECLAAIGFVCNSLNRTDDARGFFQKVLEVQPWNPLALQAMEKLDDKTDSTSQSSYDDATCMGPKKAFG